MSRHAAVAERLRQLAQEARSTVPVTEEDRLEHRILVARQRARDEAKRADSSPQLDLLEAA